MQTVSKSVYGFFSLNCFVRSFKVLHGYYLVRRVLWGKVEKRKGMEEKVLPCNLEWERIKVQRGRTRSVPGEVL